MASLRPGTPAARLRESAHWALKARRGGGSFLPDRRCAIRAGPARAAPATPGPARPRPARAATAARIVAGLRAESAVQRSSPRLESPWPRSASQRHASRSDPLARRPFRTHRRPSRRGIATPRGGQGAAGRRTGFKGWAGRLLQRGGCADRASTANSRGGQRHNNGKSESPLRTAGHAR